MVNEQRSVRFSVVIPAYNAANTLARTIESCLRQSHPPYEIIVIDDASNDATRQIAEDYGARINYIRLPKNSGSSVARNTGIEAATGDYIAFLDADDIWHKDKLKTANEVLMLQPEIYFLFHPFTIANIDQSALPTVVKPAKFSFPKLLLRNVIGTPCVVMRNDKQFYFNPSMRHMEDYDLWLRIGYKHPLYQIPFILTQIDRPVLSAGGVSGNRNAMRRGELQAYKNLARLHPLFISLLPFLGCISIAKHLWKMKSRN